ncbi:MAG TPA: single-stranded DNA-binding protein, partial [Aeromicrobium sp.]|nr:single-stranded DNA-binding protein [Aeromicrobium sp.]
GGGSGGGGGGGGNGRGRGKGGGAKPDATASGEPSVDLDTPAEPATRSDASGVDLQGGEAAP